MNVSLLNQKITIQKNTHVTDSMGNHTNTWAAYYSCHATVSGESSGGEQEAAGTTVEHPYTDFTIRWCDSVKGITPDTYRVLFNSEVYNIVGVDHMNYKRKSIKLHCKKVRG